MELVSHFWGPQEIEVPWFTIDIEPDEVGGFIGDVHGNTTTYLRKTRHLDWSIQVGDFWGPFSVLRDLNPTRHLILPGNHEIFPKFWESSNTLPHWGVVQIGTVKAFFLGGGLSVDRGGRTPGKDWFPDEEAPFGQLYLAYLAYQLVKPNVLVCHEAPSLSLEWNKLKPMSLDPPFHIKSTTMQTLDLMLSAYRPETVYHGHWHQSAQCRKEGLLIRSLGILDVQVYPHEDPRRTNR